MGIGRIKPYFGGCLPVMLLVAVPWVAGCQPSASPAEIQQMCAHLATLRKAQGDTVMIQKCVTESVTEGVSQKQATCRRYAVNTQEYWIRCRTGEPRIPVNPKQQ